MIRIENLSKAYGSKILFSQSSYHFPEGERIALVGPNGAGKSTLLNILCSIEEPDDGQILKPAKMNLGYLPQEPNQNPKDTVLEECMDGALKLKKLKHDLDLILLEMENNYSEDVHKKFEKIEDAFREAGGYALEARAKGILVGLGFLGNQLHKSPKQLSGGWRMRLELAKVFLNDPDFLVLDEPTNHLDLPSLIWVEKFLQSFAGTLLFVSHDRALLNRLSTITLHLFNGKFTPYKGNFDSFLEQREQRLELETAAYERHKKRADEIQRFVDRFKAKASKAKQAQSRMKMLERMKEVEGSFDIDNSVDEISFSLPKVTQSGKEVLKVEKMSIGYQSILSKHIELNVLRGQKIAIIGPNGIGKSTFLKTLSNVINPLEGEFTLGHNVSLAFFAQDQLDTLDENKTILDNVLSVSDNIGEKKARSVLGSFLFRGDDVFKYVKVLSGGEKSRVGLACLLLKNANFLLLDEPTNHLDMSSAEILADAIDEYEGTVLFVSHDRNFIDSICTHVFAMTNDGRFALFEGKLEDYERLAPLSGFPDILSPDRSMEMAKLIDEPVENTKVTNNAKDNEIDSKKEIQKLEKSKEKIELEIYQISEKIKEIDAQMHQLDPSDYKKMSELEKSLQVNKKKLFDNEELWLEIEAKIVKK
ncbi:ABC-F family ATP-binding cassette domain-containing protein [Pigmentibacter sp. JX0631]|uniref:ABC-F family ATP-binding cassette domain-containing protein n=1 Tax=Pigmentibacter sp. JX0631 TaxID=2976982 RepID=UPI0024682394|nr:ABC-F family ATP-binding cassette domain-containing protein [Pigmentibacter sp. JX0631]WGL60792.1 ABC-F family ATP-binding cassette domain-containing protein [Pigmentibacter sp. JX0631]